MRPGLLALADQKILNSRTFDGLSDTIGILADIATKTSSPQLAEFTQLRRDIESAYDSRPATVATVQCWLEKLETSAAVLSSQVSQFGDDASELNWWTQALHRQCRDALDDLTYLMPWSRLPAAPDWLHNVPNIVAIPTLRELVALQGLLVRKLDERHAAGITPDEGAWLAELCPLVELASLRASERIATLDSLAQQLSELAAVDYSLLYDDTRHLMAVGYNVDQHRRDSGHYDLLASEARQSTFVAIAQGGVPQESWFALGRLLTAADGDPILLSWSGSMFEYLMPLLVMPTYENTLLDQTCQAAVKRQIAYGNQRNVPWGMSESGYNTVDANLNYQYRAFGVPGLGLKRGLAEDLVIAPYASALALMVSPEAACQNLQRLTVDGLQGKYGMFEAVDYTPSRLPRGQTSVVVR